MNDQHFDEQLKQQFSDFEPAVNPAIWENIMEQRKNRKPAGFWFTILNYRNIFILAIFLLAGVTGALLLRKNLTAPDAISDQDQTKKEDQKRIPAVNAEDELNGITPLTSETSAPQATENNSFNSNRTTTHTSGKSFIQITAASLFEEKQDDLVKRNKNGRTNFDRNDPNSNEANDIVDPSSVQNNNAELFLYRLVFGRPANRNYTRSSLTINKRQFPRFRLPDCPSLEKDAAGNKKYFEIYGGPDYSFLSLKDTGNSAYLQKRKESLRFSSAFSAGLRYTRVFNNGMSIRTGLNYSQINEKFTFVQGNLVQITYIIDANGDTTGSYITRGTRYKTTYNKYRTLDIPLLLGYELGNGKLHANINAGAVINIYSWQKGEMLDTASKPVSITTGKSSSPYGFKTNAGIGFMGSVSVYYKLNEKMHLLAEPYFRYNFSPMNKDRITLKQKYNTTGLRVGLRIDLP